MARHPSAIKRAKQSVNRRMRNRQVRSHLRTSMKKLRGAVADKDQATAQSLLPLTISDIDRTARKGTIHRNTAARYKSRLTRLVNTLGADS